VREKGRYIAVDPDEYPLLSAGFKDKNKEITFIPDHNTYGRVGTTDYIRGEACTNAHEHGHLVPSPPQQPRVALTRPLAGKSRAFGARPLSRKQVRMSLLLGGVEPNPGPVLHWRARTSRLQPRTLTRREIEILLMIGGVEVNPGPEDSLLPAILPDVPDISTSASRSASANESHASTTAHSIASVASPDAQQGDTQSVRRARGVYIKQHNMDPTEDLSDIIDTKKQPLPPAQKKAESIQF